MMCTRMRPSLVVFDLDLTLWPFRLDKHAVSPFNLRDQKVTDNFGKELSPYKETIPILTILKERGFILGLASRIDDICGAYQLLSLLSLSSFFTYREIYPGNKRNHFNSLQKKSGISFADMLFFDDDKRNIHSVSKLGVRCVQVIDGISLELVTSNL